MIRGGMNRRTGDVQSTVHVEAVGFGLFVQQAPKAKSSPAHSEDLARTSTIGRLMLPHCFWAN